MDDPQTTSNPLTVGLLADFASPIARAFVGNLRELFPDPVLFGTRFDTGTPQADTATSLTTPNRILARASARVGGSGLSAGSTGTMRGRILQVPVIDSTVRHAIEIACASATRRRTATLFRRYPIQLLHALRIPYEAIYAERGLHDDPLPFVVSVWGNDFTLHARHSRMFARATRRVLERASALVADCRRDLVLAEQFGFDRTRPSLVIPGSGGLDLGIYQPHKVGDDDRVLASFGLEPGTPIVLNPRGLRSYIRTDVFLQAVPRILEQDPEVTVCALGLSNYPAALRVLSSLGNGRLRLLPTVSPSEMPALFRAAQVVVSPASHDGTPNALLEAMACGALPVVGDLPSIREWVRPGENGLLFDVGSAADLTGAVVRALGDSELRAGAVEMNDRLVRQRADRRVVSRQIRDLYQTIAG